MSIVYYLYIYLLFIYNIYKQRQETFLFVESCNLLFAIYVRLLLFHYIEELVQAQKNASFCWIRTNQVMNLGNINNEN